MKKVYEVELKGSKLKYHFEKKQEAEDFAFVQSVFLNKKYRIQAIFINESVEEVAK